MICAKCSSQMEIVAYTGVPVDRCTNCQGLWFHPEEFRKLRRDDWLAEHIDAGDRATGRRYNRDRIVKCPDCGARMNHVKNDNQPHILYEQCPNDCGVFFDAGEFRDLATQTFWDKFKTRKILDR